MQTAELTRCVESHSVSGTGVLRLVRCAAGKAWLLFLVLRSFTPTASSCNTLTVHHIASSLELLFAKSLLCEWPQQSVTGAGLYHRLLNFGTRTWWAGGFCREQVRSYTLWFVQQHPCFDSLDAAGSLLNCEAKTASRPCRLERSSRPPRAAATLFLSGLAFCDPQNKGFSHDTSFMETPG